MVGAAGPSKKKDVKNKKLQDFDSLSAQLSTLQASIVNKSLDQLIWHGRHACPRGAASVPPCQGHTFQAAHADLPANGFAIGKRRKQKTHMGDASGARRFPSSRLKLTC